MLDEPKTWCPCGTCRSRYRVFPMEIREGLSFQQQWDDEMAYIDKQAKREEREQARERQSVRLRRLTSERKLRRHHIYEMRKEGKSIADIAQQIGRTKQSVYLLFKSEHRSRVWWWRRGGIREVVRGNTIIQDELIQQ